MHRAAPEFCETLALDFNMLDVFGVFGGRYRRYFLIEADMNYLFPLWIDLYFLGGTVQVSGSPVPSLALSSIHREFDCVAVSPVEGFVAVEKGLNPVFSPRDLSDTLQRKSKNGIVDNGFLIRFQAVDIDPKNELSVWAFTDLEAGLSTIVRGDHEQHPAIQRIWMLLQTEGYPEAKLGVRFSFLGVTIKRM
jgi:hypothetical protein